MEEGEVYYFNNTGLIKAFLHEFLIYQIIFGLSYLRLYSYKK